MVKKISIIFFTVLVFFVLEHLLFSNFGKWFKPNFLFLLTIFYTLYWGIRFGLLSAVLCGMLKDSFFIGMWGGNVFSLVACAFIATLLRKYVYMMNSQWSRWILVVSVLFLNMFFNYVLFIMSASISFFQVFYHIFIPEALTTLVATNITFDILRKCASKLSV